jgi:hypothetical protein
MYLINASFPPGNEGISWTITRGLRLNRDNRIFRGEILREHLGGCSVTDYLVKLVCCHETFACCQLINHHPGGTNRRSFIASGGAFGAGGASGGTGGTGRSGSGISNDINPPARLQSPPDHR